MGGCDTNVVVAALGLTLKDLMAPTDTPPPSPRGTKTTVGPAELDDLRAYLRARWADLHQRDSPTVRQALTYLHDRFGLTAQLARTLGVGLDPGGSSTERPPWLSTFRRTPRLIIPFTDPNGTPRSLQGRALDAGVEQRWDAPAGTGWAQAAYYQLHLDGPVLICEGPGDALTATAAGHPAIAIRGAQLASDTLADELATHLGATRAVVCGDNDPAGQQWAARLTERLAARGITVTTLTPPGDGQDLTDWRNTSPATFTDTLDQALNHLEFPEPLEAAPTGPRTHECTDLGNARRLVDSYGHQLRHVPEQGRWLTWDGTRWRRDITGAVHRAAKDTIEAIADEARAATSDDQRKHLIKHWLRSQQAQRLAAVVTLTTTEPGIPLQVDQLDANPWALNVTNGTIDLRTGRLHPHQPTDNITKLAQVTHDPDATCPTWEAFLDRIFDQDRELISFVQRAVGYSLTGDVTEQLLFFAHGHGSNGKSTMLKALQRLLGDYARQADGELLLARTNDAHPTGIADLIGARLAVCTEVDQGRYMAEATMKQLTGGDRIKARFMRQDFFEFEPSHKLWLIANHRPQVRGTDHAVWRRIRLIPFDVTITEDEKDTHLDDKLAAELPGILNWAVAGCLTWQRQGLGAPAKVLDATAEYRTENDVIGAFLDECTLQVPGQSTSAATIRESYVAWCEENGERPVSQRKFAPHLAERGLERFKHRTSWWWRGILMAPDGLAGVDNGARPQLADQDVRDDAPLCPPSQRYTHSAGAGGVHTEEGAHGARRGAPELPYDDLIGF